METLKSALTEAKLTNDFYELTTSSANKSFGAATCANWVHREGCGAPVMDFNSIRAELEQDLAWRVDEIRFLQNQGSALGEDDKRRYRRALVLILYSHFEGFCKFSFSHYVRILNAVGVKCCDAKLCFSSRDASDGLSGAARYAASEPALPPEAARRPWSSSFRTRA